MQVYNLEQDHKEIKEQIKDWEVFITKIIEDKGREIDCSTLEDLEYISEQMMTINL